MFEVDCLQVDLLAHLDLTGNLIDDNRARLLSSGLANNHTITHLCLAHNKVPTRCWPARPLKWAQP